ncbi:hypothetical protein F4777DRAFT_507985 [Nemania sp. FL0916]|nr:hypothetical protein F4777DRAFT_507985 [Nemania sp. FL0916]
MTLDIKTFYPNPELTTTVTGHPGGVAKTADVFILSHPDFMNLLRYVRAGCSLPTKHDEYVQRMGIDESVKAEVAKEVDMMVNVYADVQIHNDEFLLAWSGLRANVAHKLTESGNKADGTTLSSDYVALLKALKKWNDENNKSSPDKTVLEDQRRNIGEHAQRAAFRAMDLQVLSQGARRDFEKFKNASTSHSSMLQTNNEVLKKLLDEGDIKTLQQTLREEHDELSLDLHVTETTPAYAWCTTFGLVAAVSVNTPHSSKIEQIKKNIEETEREIDTDQKKLKAARIICADAQRIADDTMALLNLITSAIKTLESLETMGKNIATDFMGLNQTARDEKQVIPPFHVDDALLAGVTDSWNKLGTRVDQFIDHASFVFRDPKNVTVKEWVDEYGTKH